MRFQATLELHGKTATGVQVPDEVVAALGSSAARRERDGQRPQLAQQRGPHGWGVPARDQRREPGGRWGECRGRARCRLELDTAEREVAVPGDLAAALDARSGARAAFDALAYSNRRGIVTAVEDAKTEQTRQRRIAKAVTTLVGE